jgi:hypothetical protein
MHQWLSVRIGGNRTESIPTHTHTHQWNALTYRQECCLCTAQHIQCCTLRHNDTNARSLAFATHGRSWRTLTPCLRPTEKRPLPSPAQSYVPRLASAQSLNGAYEASAAARYGAQSVETGPDTVMLLARLHAGEHSEPRRR